MLIPRINRGAPDKVFAIVRNLHSATLNDGDCVQWLSSADTPPTGYVHIPGVDVKGGSGPGNTLVAGVMALGGAGLVQGDFGTCQVWGFHSNVKTTVAALAAATVVNIDAASAAVAGAVADDPSSRMGICLKVGAGNRAGIMIKCM